MGRRSLHSPEELRRIILTSARSIIEKDGLAGLSAREIAKLISYSPGTLYNIFENLDDVLLTLQVELLRDAAEALAATPPNATPEAQIDAMAKSYVAFALQNRRLWNLLFAHNLPDNMPVPTALHETAFSIIQQVKLALIPLMPEATDATAALAARALWAGVHGITAIAVTEKAPVLSASNVDDFVHMLTSTFVRGLRHG